MSTADQMAKINLNLAGPTSPTLKTNLSWKSKPGVCGALTAASASAYIHVKRARARTQHSQTPVHTLHTVEGPVQAPSNLMARKAGGGGPTSFKQSGDVGFTPEDKTSGFGKVLGTLFG